MQRTLTTAVVVVSLFLLLGSAGGTGQPVSGRATAIDALERLGARVALEPRRFVTGADDPREKLTVALRDQAVKDSDLKHLRELPDVAHLELRGTPITDAGLVHLQALTNLEHLDLYDTVVGDAGLEQLQDLKKLRFLMLKQTNMTDVGVQRLQRALPECVISHSPRIYGGELPKGKWTVAFANGVQEECEVRGDGAASVVEPRRTSAGKATMAGAATLIVFADDRLERWTPVGQRMVVEHWFPASQYPLGQPVLGIADRVR